MKKYRVLIEGMHCSSCSSNLERSLKKIRGVKEVSVSLLTRKAMIEAEDSVNEEDLKKAVSRVGNYKVIKVEAG